MPMQGPFVYGCGYGNGDGEGVSPSCGDTHGAG
jgi:hypothetical protein